MSYEGIDLVCWQQGGTRKMMAVTDEWHSSSVDAPGAIAPLAIEVMRQFPTRFDTEGDAQLFLTMLHFRNMSRHTNSAGQGYPMILDGQ